MTTASPKRTWLPWTATAALLLGAVVTALVLPIVDRAQAIADVASSNTHTRDQAWAWLSAKAPGATRPRVLILLDGQPDALADTMLNADVQARRDAAVSLLSLERFTPTMLSQQSWAPIIEALNAGSPDEQTMAMAIESFIQYADALHDGHGGVTMPPISPTLPTQHEATQ